MNVSMWMTREVTTIGPATVVAQAARLMAEKRIRRLLVSEAHGAEMRLLGIVSAKDVLHAFPPEVNPFAVIGPDARQAPLTVDQIMTRQLCTTTPETPIEVAAGLMRDRKIGALPVLRHQRLVGIITESDIFRAFVSLFSTEEPGARITFDVTKGEDVFNLVGRFAQRDRVKISSLVWTEQDNQPVCVVRVLGERVDRLLDDIWGSGHLVLNVIRYPLAGESEPDCRIPG